MPTGEVTAMSGTESARLQNQHRSGEWISLVVPWIKIGLIATVASAVISLVLREDHVLFQSLRHGRGMLENTTTFSYITPLFEDHKPLFPLNSSDYYGLFFTVVALMIAAGGGIGGGGILIPIYILVLGFSPMHAIPLSNVTVLGGAVANTVLNVFKRHPLADRPLVDWDLILVMEPPTIASALIGAFLNKVLPRLLLLVLLDMLLAFTAWETLTKAIKMYKKETRAMKGYTRIGSEEYREQDSAENLFDGTEERKVETDEQKATRKQQQEQQDRKALEIKDELAKILDDERVMPVTNLWILVTLFLVVLAVNVLKGGGAFRSPLGIVCGSPGFWTANAFMIVWILVVCFFARRLLIKKYEAKTHCGFEYVEGDIQWDSRATLVYPAICCFAGFFAGMFGVGGGIVKGPLMLAMGVHPAVASASSACMILFTSFTATTSFFVFGLLLPDYGVVCLAVGFIATIVGQEGLMYLMKRSQRNSYIAFSIGSVVLISAVLMSIQSLLSIVSGEKHHSGGICGKGD